MLVTSPRKREILTKIIALLICLMRILYQAIPWPPFNSFREWSFCNSATCLLLRPVSIFVPNCWRHLAHSARRGDGLWSGVFAAWVPSWLCLIVREIYIVKILTMIRFLVKGIVGNVNVYTKKAWYLSIQGGGPRRIYSQTAKAAWRPDKKYRSPTAPKKTPELFTLMML